ncbi:hypothetical protein AAMO2058_000274300 [Amorphochlora amoebiformis]|uniref:tRNA-uridine aminocarboxypropyltransferase n=1 Tax=Amorphochlora amoebiformis TaxID=1561963 RepID=A0A7S0DCE4_9EUKA|mmetsp:Transcript_22697/g.35646  ORF Transcript_22697/g.35646 Transcript_22697/m.35646 type:complete len:344 (+) Transcript_22697:49-1080(+)
MDGKPEGTTPPGTKTPFLEKGITPCGAHGENLALETLGVKNVARRIMCVLDHQTICTLMRVCKSLGNRFKEYKFYIGAARFLKGREKHTAKIKCSRCWLTKRYCACASLDQISKKIHLDFEVILFIHYREVARKMASNTARLLPICVGARVYIYGDIHSEDNMLEDIRKMMRRGGALVLFPSDDSLTSQQFLNKYSKKGGDGKNQATKNGIGLIIIDGTWNNARRMNTFIPGCVPRVKLSTPSRAKFRNMRKHSEKGRVSTMSAFIHLLEELGVREELTCPLGDALNLIIEKYYSQSHKPVCEVVNSRKKFAKRAKDRTKAEGGEQKSSEMEPERDKKRSRVT